MHVGQFQFALKYHVYVRFLSLSTKVNFKKGHICPVCIHISKVRNREKIRNRYNQAPHLTQDTNGKVTTSQLDITNERQEISSFPAGDHKASTNRRAWKHNKTRQK